MTVPTACFDDRIMDEHFDADPCCQPEAYLNLTRLTEGIYLVGVLDTGVTIYNQQVRALNLVWALDHAGLLDDSRRIAIVGGGIAGLTAAAAVRNRLALNSEPSKYTLTVFEERSVLCPLQRGCATRWVHPHIYDWPEAKSTNPSAGLPILNWRAGRASDVAADIVRQWEEEGKKQGPTISEWRNLRYLRIDHSTREIEWVGENEVGSTPSPRPIHRIRGDKAKYDLIILAIGFGEEHSDQRFDQKSYWRNETYGQPDLSGRQQSYLVSGTGDGGLIDLLRVRIVDFREDRIGSELAAEGSPALDQIRSLRSTCYESGSDTAARIEAAARMFDQSRRLGRDLQLVDRMQQRLRADTVATLQIRTGTRVSDAFRGNSSFVNRFLVSLLFEAGGFTPHFGDLKTVDDRFDHVIVRHGTNNRGHLQNIFTSDVKGLVQSLDERCVGDRMIQPKPCWEPGWPFNRKAHTGPGAAKRDYVPDATIAVASTFIGSLRSVFAARAGNYRATLHRVVATDTRGTPKEVHLQQVAHYQGPRAKTDSEAVGRLFKVDDAVIGLAVRTRCVLFTHTLDVTDAAYRKLLREDMKRLGGEDWDPKRMDDEVAALLACPILYPSGGPGTTDAQASVIAVLFADSTNVAAFDEECISQIIEACSGFGAYLSSIVRADLTEVVSVKAQATSYQAPDLMSAGSVLADLRTLAKAAPAPPRVDFAYINLEWRS